MSRSNREELFRYATMEQPRRMLRGVPPAAGPTGTVGRVRTTPELHGAVRSGTAGRVPNRDHGPRAGCGSYASTHAHLGTAGRGTRKGTVGCERAGGAA